MASKLSEEQRIELRSALQEAFENVDFSLPPAEKEHLDKKISRGLRKYAYESRWQIGCDLETWLQRCTSAYEAAE